jgi:hypothetical protein
MTATVTRLRANNNKLAQFIIDLLQQVAMPDDYHADAEALAKKVLKE